MLFHKMGSKIMTINCFMINYEFIDFKLSIESKSYVLPLPLIIVIANYNFNLSIFLSLEQVDFIVSCATQNSLLTKKMSLTALTLDSPVKCTTSLIPT